MNLVKEKVEEIAGELEAGLTCYVNIETEEILSVYENDDDFFITEGEDEDKLAKVFENPDTFIKVEGLTSQEEFFLMQNFTDSIKDQSQKNSLLTALSNRKPFVNFKEIVDNSPELKEKWTDFKLSSFVDLVNQQLLEQE